MKIREDLGSDIKIFQDDELYTFTSDAILLSRFARVKPKETVADFCAGCGIVGFELYRLSPDKISSVAFFEMQKPLFDLIEENIAYNGLGDKFSAYNVKIQDIPKEFYGKFSLITCNPPYMKKDAGEKDASETIAVCRREMELDIDALVSAIKKGLKFGGRACLVYRADRLVDIVVKMRENGIEPKRIVPVAPKGKKPYLVLVEGVKGGKSGLDLCSAIEN
ncbi:MAG: methyltransferase [Clostridia bacterium]|nr:methyltransferase [Clostridia bacterium]